MNWFNKHVCILYTFSTLRLYRLSKPFIIENKNRLRYVFNTIVADDVTIQEPINPHRGMDLVVLWYSNLAPEMFKNSWKTQYSLFQRWK